jgi:hypothetical protein
MLAFGKDRMTKLPAPGRLHVAVIRGRAALAHCTGIIEQTVGTGPLDALL